MQSAKPSPVKDRAQESVNALNVADLTVTYGAFRAIENISFVVPSGAVMGLIGPNGAGKSTCQ